MRCSGIHPPVQVKWRCFGCEALDRVRVSLKRSLVEAAGYQIGNDWMHSMLLFELLRNTDTVDLAPLTTSKHLRKELHHIEPRRAAFREAVPVLLIEVDIRTIDQARREGESRL